MRPRGTHIHGAEIKLRMVAPITVHRMKFKVGDVDLNAPMETLRDHCRRIVKGELGHYLAAAYVKNGVTEYLIHLDGATKYYRENGWFIPQYDARVEAYLVGKFFEAYDNGRKLTRPQLSDSVWSTLRVKVSPDDCRHLIENNHIRNAMC